MSWPQDLICDIGRIIVFLAFESFELVICSASLIG
jgi:hypothetical protein